MKNPPVPDLGKVFKENTESIGAESDRGAALVAASMLETILKTLIENRLLETEDDNDKLFSGAMAPLSTFSARTEMAYRLGLIPIEMKSMLNMFRGIRNDFAHKTKYNSFEDQSIHDRLRRTFTAQQDFYDLIIAQIKLRCEELNDSSQGKEFSLEENWSLRATFNFFFGITITTLSALAPNVSRIPPEAIKAG